ncbi:MAG: hypothetical protein D6748_10905 [Calditrichaeota bacterium]|nr:MAG: hypothetical protein D6748_10905 [Calditrichota bacterium]
MNDNIWGRTPISIRELPEKIHMNASIFPVNQVGNIRNRIMRIRCEFEKSTSQPSLEFLPIFFNQIFHQDILSH